MLDRKPEPAWTRWAQHQPVGISRKIFVGKRLAEHLVIDAEILHGHATLRYSGRAAGLEDVRGQVCEAFGHPAANRTSAEPLILEGREFSEIRKAVDLPSRVPVQLGSKIQPERTAGFVIKMPLDDIPHMCIQPCVGILYSGGKSDFGCRRPHSLHSRSAMAIVVLKALVLQPSITTDVAKLSYSVLPRCAKRLLSALDTKVFLDEFMASYQLLHSLQSRPSKKPQQKSCNKGHPVKIRKAVTNSGAADTVEARKAAIATVVSSFC